MAVVGKTWVTRFVLLALALSLLAGGCRVWEQAGIRSRPWFLESYMESRLGDCRTGPGSVYFQREFEQLAARAEDAKQAVREADQKWLTGRDYSACVLELLTVCAEIELLRTRLGLRQQEQKKKAEVLLASFQAELGARYQNGEFSPKVRMQSMEQRRARSFMEQAEYLKGRGEFEATLEMMLRAQTAWQNHNHLIDQQLSRFDDSGLRRQWDLQATELVRWTRQSGRRAVLVDKLEHRCMLLSGGQVEKSFSASLSRNWQAQKVQEQDAATPEGKYKVVRMISGGKYGLALLLDYPNAADRERFAALKREGTISRDARIGGSVEIHGAGRPDSDWTDGCVSLNDREMMELYRHAYKGMPVTIIGTSKTISAPPE